MVMKLLMEQMNPNPDDIKFFLAENEKLPATPQISLISEYAQNKRIIFHLFRFGA